MAMCTNNASVEISVAFDAMQVLTSILRELPKLLHAKVQERQGAIQEEVDNDKLQISQGEIVDLIRHELVCVDVALPPGNPKFGNSVILVVGSNEKRIGFVIVDILNRIRMTFKVVTPINIIGKEDEWLKGGGLERLHSKITSQNDICIAILCTLNKFERVYDFMEKIFVPIEDVFEEEEKKMPIGVPTSVKNTIKKPSRSKARKPVPSPITVYTNFCKMQNLEVEQVLPKPIILQPLQSQQPNHKDDVDGNKLDKKEACLCGELCCCIFLSCFD